MLLGWVLLGLAAGVRPQLAPSLALVGVAGIWMLRERPKLTMHGVLLGLAVLAVLYGRAALDAGGLISYVELSQRHYERHVTDIDGAGPLPFSEQGLVRALGGLGPTALWILLTLFGAVREWTRGGVSGRWLVVLAVVTLWSVQALHHPGFPRYAVATILASLPLVVAAVATLPRLAALGGTALFAALAALAAWPAVWTMHTERLPVSAAADALDRPRTAPVIYSFGSFSFARLVAQREGFSRKMIDQRSRGELPTHNGPFDFFGTPLPRVLPGLTVTERIFDDFPEAAWSLSQRRFESARIVSNPIWLGKGSHHVETGARGEAFSWLGEQAVLHLPGKADTLVLRLELNEGMGPQRIQAFVGDERRTDVRFEQPGLWRTEVDLEGCKHPCTVRLKLPHARELEGDKRKLSMRLRAVWVEGPDYEIPRREWSPGLPGSLLASDVTLMGFHRAQTFMKSQRPGAWAQGRAQVRFPARPGWLRLKVARPEHLTGPVTITTRAGQRRVEPPPQPTDYWVPIRRARWDGPGDDRLTELRAQGARPGEQGRARAGSDRARGGVRARRRAAPVALRPELCCRAPWPGAHILIDQVTPMAVLANSGKLAFCSASATHLPSAVLAWVPCGVALVMPPVLPSIETFT